MKKCSSAAADLPSRFVHKRIKLRPQNEARATDIAGRFKIGEIAAKILAARGFDDESQIKNYILPSLKEGLLDPSELKNLPAACEMIGQSIRARDPIAICCDFDVDGLSAGAQLERFLSACGVKVRVFVPNRFTDGYGLNEKLIREVAAEGFKLMIAVDYGTSNPRELELARSLGLKTIVVDHHHVQQAPPADVFINPQQPGCGFANGILCAAGLVWYLIVGLRSHLGSDVKTDPKAFLDLACLGTICDMVPLIGINRVIARRGLELLEKTDRAGLQALKNVMGLKRAVSCSDVSFGIGPRLNAAGRIVHGELVIQLLTTSDSRSAEQLARQLNKLNEERQEVENAVRQAALAKLGEIREIPHGIVVWDEAFHTGVIGIVAQRLVELFYRPTAVVGRDEEGIYKGSVRGIKGFSVVECLKRTGDHLIKFGGHDGAGGFSVRESKLEDFAAAFNSACAEMLAEVPLEPVVEADTEVQLSEIDPRLVDELQRFAPFGVGNPGPLVLIKNLEVMNVKVLKEAHLKVDLKDGRNRRISGLMWRQTSHPALQTGALVNVACRPDTNSFNGRLEMQLNLQAIERAPN